MSKDKNTTPETLEAALVVIENLNSELTASATLVEASKKAFEDLTNEMEQLKANHALELDLLKSEVSSITKEVVGSYKSKKHKGKVIRFKTGFIKTRVNGEIVPSKDLIENEGGKYTEFLDNLIAIGYGGIEEVN